MTIYYIFRIIVIFSSILALLLIFSRVPNILKEFCKISGQFGMFRPIKSDSSVQFLILKT